MAWVRRLLVPLLLAGLWAPPPAAAQTTETALRSTLQQSMRAAGPASGAWVLNATERRTVFARRSSVPRVLASNTKLFTTAAALDHFGPDAAFETAVVASGALAPDGTWHGDLVLRGGGDPAFGSRAFSTRAYGPGEDHVEGLADAVVAAGITAVRGRVLGDETLLDPLRGGPDSGYRVSSYVGPLSALAFDRGLAGERGTAFQRSPPAYAAGRLDAALEALGVRVSRKPAAGPAPPDAVPLASVTSPPMARLVQVTNKRSDNYFAEMLLKNLGASAGGQGSTAAGARVAAAYARTLGARPNLADGSGLSEANLSSPRDVVRLLDGLSRRPDFPRFLDSLAVAGRDGTLRDRMRRSRARGRCQGKTGSLLGVSTLSGYCTARDGDRLVFSFLMNRVNTASARRLQDRMAGALAASGG